MASCVWANDHMGPNTYEEKAQTASIEPDMALLTPILEVMQRLKPSPENQG